MYGANSAKTECAAYLQLTTSQIEFAVVSLITTWVLVILAAWNEWSEVLFLRLPDIPESTEFGGVELLWQQELILPFMDTHFRDTGRN
jgi:hypothetical protein